jgi:hypothetical protein
MGLRHHELLVREVEAGGMPPSEVPADVCGQTPGDSMSPERLGRLRLIGVTALITFVVTLAGAGAILTVVSRQPPPTPRLPPPKSITVTLYPAIGLSSAGPPTEIPAGEIDHVMRLVTPDKYVEGGVNDWLWPLIAEVVIAHEGQPATCLFVRWAGEKPAAVSADGRNYFYARPHEEIYDGGRQLITLVQRLAEAKKP